MGSTVDVGKTYDFWTLRKADITVLRKDKKNIQKDVKLPDRKSEDSIPEMLQFCLYREWKNRVV